ncbi:MULTISPECIES: putative 2-aminoethylphosphonate ABC transporter permease subunit [Aminobacter]|jgi:iron(III) transport system permease protein|uniref:Iron ABC transporter permease n=2 Tax=Aminobacter TaxID=31988 RepID=A0AAC8YUP0_AMIAI|nr:MULTISPECIES: putative 2-aminoethylphosphonate ABC transporter permease subunit [Aminobacter]AMS44740.1 iron ABC transporter permease [Aminobacter aminovorans]MBA8908078.1 iron(III) transport system permease protein [Aminobacter ciceronei]MBA9021938.1 iron(III) transport system permease protein [Aminobacter ciceronei]MBB3704467.1 iron(III) transport system permease protein [Aminobacter aminovorans]MRX32297.1 putative 2-aminoethylphosphonate ABC transporter permease subunit [Aminobacter sp. 
MAMALDSALPVGRSLRLRLDRDELIKRGLMVVIALYLVVGLAAPLAIMLSKSFSTYSFNLANFEFQVSDKDGNWGQPVTAAALNEKLDAVPPAKLATNSDGRLQATSFFPDFSFRSPVKYKIRGTTSDATYLVGLKPQTGTEWQELTSNDFRRVMLRPSRALGLENYAAYFSTPTLFRSIENSVFIALVSTIITVGLAFGFAYALNRSCMRFKGVFKLVAMVPILVPSLLPGIALIYLFGNQGMLKDLLMGASIYGPLGIVVGSIFFAFPHAMIIISTALAISDQRHYEAAASLRASRWRTFWTVTIPGARYGLISAAFVVFTLVITDFGLPKVIGGQYNVLAVDIYKQVIGQQNFEMGAVVSVILLVPAIAAFIVDRMVTKKQVALLSARSVPYQPKPNRGFDTLCLAWCSLIAVFILGIMATSQFAALVKLWPYDLSLGLKHFAFDRMDGGGWGSYYNSIRLAALTAVIGTVIIFVGAYMVEKTDGFRAGRTAFQFLAMLPMAVPGMVLGLAYIFFFNDPANPLHAIYGTMTILVVCTITHFYTVGHLTALTALKQIDQEFEPVAASLKQPFYKLFARVTVPVCLPAILDISIYIFVNAMTTVSAVVFLYSKDTTLASVAVLNMDDAGDVAPAAAMAMMIFYTNAAARLIHLFLSRVLIKRTQAWRMR